MKKVITTVGTSIFTNYQKGHKDINDKIECLKSEPYSKWDDWKDDIKHIEDTIHQWLISNNNSSAEIKSILKLTEEYGDVSIHLIATHTILSVLAATILRDYFKRNNIEYEFSEGKDIIKGLQVSDARTFEKEGVIHLIDRLHTIISSCENLIFNITGGYKALIPYMTIMGQIYNIPIYYIFEDTDKLIKIPQAPVDFDFSVIDENYIAFQSLGKTKSSSLEEFTREFTQEVFDRLKNKNLVEEIDEKVKLTPLGNMLVKRYEDLFNSGKYNKQNLISNLIELKLCKYFVKKYRDKKASVEHGKKLGEKGYDIDIYIENKNTTAIEVKSGGNVPIYKDKAGKESIEHKLTEGGFKHLIDNHNGKNLKLEVFLYSSKPIHYSVVEQMRGLCKKYSKKTENLRWFWLKIPDNYSTNTHWDIKKEDIAEISIKEAQNV